MKPPLEQQEAFAIANWLRAQRVDGKPIAFLHIPNEREASVAQLMSLIRAGLQQGFPDYLVLTATPAAPRGAAFELKRRTGGKATPKQEAWVRVLNDELGIPARVCNGAREAAQFLAELGYGPAPQKGG